MLLVTSSIRVMTYEWNTTKAIENRRKHGIDFTDAIGAIEDSNRLEEIDDRFEYGEERMRIIGMAIHHILFVITTTRGDDTCRIISARRATRHEQERYYTRDPEAW
jgi:uncharacterized DUF497 family protein